MFASLSIFLHISHVKLALKISASTSMCSNAGFMLAFCPRRLFNILLFFIFLCRKQQHLQKAERFFPFFLFHLFLQPAHWLMMITLMMHETQKTTHIIISRTRTKFGHHKNHQKWMDEKKWCPPLLRTTPLGYFGNQLWTRHDFPRRKRRGFSRLFVFCGRRF